MDTTTLESLKKNQATPSNGRGGRREGAGRPKGSVSERKKVEQVTKAMIQELALQHAKTAISALLDVVNDKGNAQRVSAANALLDRGLGKPKQEIAGDPEAPLMFQEVRWKFMTKE